MNYNNYNYDKLLGKIKEKKYTQETLAKELGMQTATLNQKLNNRARFKQGEISAMCKLLDIKDNEIGKYFFAH